VRRDPSSRPTDPAHAKRQRWLALTAFALGALTLLLLLLAQPAIYLRLADGLRWRLGLPALAQINYEQSLALAQQRGESQAGPCALLLFGDSHLQGLPSSALGVEVNNFAIAGEPAERLAQRIVAYASVKQARHIVLLSGANDLATGRTAAQAAASMAAVLAQIPASTSLSLLGLPPSSQPARPALNAALQAMCTARPGCGFVSLDALGDGRGALRAELAAADGIHLSATGYGRLAATIRAVLPKHAQCAH